MKEEAATAFNVEAVTFLETVREVLKKEAINKGEIEPGFKATKYKISIALGECADYYSYRSFLPLFW